MELHCNSKINGKEMSFKVVTGTEVTDISDGLWESLEMNAISQVKELTPWCAGMLVVLEKSGSVCICVDFDLSKTTCFDRCIHYPKQM